MSHGTDAHAFFHDIFRILVIALAPHVATGRVVAREQLVPDDYACPETRAERHTNQVVVTPLRAAGFQPVVYLR